MTPVSEVECLVYTWSYENGYYLLLKIEPVSLTLTPYHPVINTITASMDISKSQLLPLK